MQFAQLGLASYYNFAFTKFNEFEDSDTVSIDFSTLCAYLDIHQLAR